MQMPPESRLTGGGARLTSSRLGSAETWRSARAARGRDVRRSYRAGSTTASAVLRMRRNASDQTIGSERRRAGWRGITNWTWAQCSGNRGSGTARQVWGIESSPSTKWSADRRLSRYRSISRLRLKHRRVGGALQGLAAGADHLPSPRGIDFDVLQRHVAQRQWPAHVELPEAITACSGRCGRWRCEVAQRGCSTTQKTVKTTKIRC